MKSLQLQLVLAVLAVACGGEVGAGTDVGGREQDESSSVSSGSGSDASSSFTGSRFLVSAIPPSARIDWVRTTNTTSGSSRVTETGVPSSGAGPARLGLGGTSVAGLSGPRRVLRVSPRRRNTACQDVANSDNGDECGSLSTAFANSGYCTGTSPPPRTPMWCTGLGFCCRASANQEACAGIAAGGDESACALALSTYCIE